MLSLVVRHPFKLIHPALSSQMTCHISQRLSHSSYSYRTHTCGEITSQHSDANVVLCGWISSVKSDNHPSATITDSYGATQLQFKNLDEISTLVPRSVVVVHGKVSRSKKQGKTRVHVLKHFIFNEHSCLTEESCVALRKPDVQNYLRKRSTILHKIRTLLIQNKFVEIETPFLHIKSSKNIELMVNSNVLPSHRLLFTPHMSKYFQIFRSVKQNHSSVGTHIERTSIEAEMTTQSLDDVIAFTKSLIHTIYNPETVLWNVLSYDELFDVYGDHKPDLRYTDSKLVKISHIPETDHPFMVKSIDDNCLDSFAIKIPAKYNLSIDDIELIQQKVREKYFNLLLCFACQESVDMSEELELAGEIVLNYFIGTKQALIDILDLQNGDLCLVSSGKSEIFAKTVLGYARKLVADKVIKSHDKTEKFSNFVVSCNLPYYKIGNMAITYRNLAMVNEDSNTTYNYNTFNEIRGVNFCISLNGMEVGWGALRKETLKYTTVKYTQSTSNQSLKGNPYGGLTLYFDLLLAMMMDVQKLGKVPLIPSLSRDHYSFH